MKKWTTWALESAKVTHWHDATADNDCSGDTPACLISRLDTIKMWNLQEFWKLSRQPWWLCHADVFHLCLLCSPTFWTLHLWSRLSVRRPPLSPLLFTLSIDTPTPPLPLSLCFTGGGWLSLPPGLAITRNLLSIAPFDFSQMCHVPTSISFTFHCQTLKLLFVLPFISHLVSLWLMNTCYKVDPVVFFFPYSGHPCLEAHHHYRSSSFFTIFTFKPAYMVSFLISALLEYLNFFFSFLHKIHSQNSKALHDLHWATLCCKEKICCQFKDVTVWIIGVASDHRNNKAIFSYFGCLLSTNLGFSCACVYLVCSVGGVCQVNCHGNI